MKPASRQVDTGQSRTIRTSYEKVTKRLRNCHVASEIPPYGSERNTCVTVVSTVNLCVFDSLNNALLIT